MISLQSMDLDEHIDAHESSKNSFLTIPTFHWHLLLRRKPYFKGDLRSPISNITSLPFSTSC